MFESAIADAVVVEEVSGCGLDASKSCVSKGSMRRLEHWLAWRIWNGCCHLALQDLEIVEGTMLLALRHVT